MATALPITSIHHGAVEGMFIARMMPVTTAERSVIVIGFFKDPLPEKLPQHAGRDADSKYTRGVPTKEPNTRRNRRRHQRGDDVAHQNGGRILCEDMRRRGDGKTFFASIQVTSSPLRQSSSLAALKTR